MNLNSSRRGFLGTLGAVAAALATPRKLFGAKPSAPQPAASITGLGQSGNPYQELGVTHCHQWRRHDDDARRLADPARSRSRDGASRAALRQHF